MSELVQNYVGGRWTSSGATETLAVLNPASGEELGRVPLSPRADLTTLSIDLTLVLLSLLLLWSTRTACGTASAPGPAGGR